MSMKVWTAVFGCGLAIAGCDNSSGGSGGTSGGQGTSTTDDVATTIPVTSVTETTADPTTDSTSSSSGDTGSGTDTDATDTDTTDTDSTSTGDPTGSTTDETSGSSSETTTGTPTQWVVEWCNLQFPPTIEGTTETITPVYSRVYVEGLTDQTPGNDIDDQLVVEFGYGDDGSDPAAGWTWVAGEGNPGWNGADAGAPNNDEYQADLVFSDPGTYDYAARVSGDGGTTWVYCDLDGLVEGGYTSDQAGAATIE